MEFRARQSSNTFITVVYTIENNMYIEKNMIYVIRRTIVDTKNSPEVIYSLPKIIYDRFLQAFFVVLF